MAKREAKTDGTHSFPRFVSMQACAAATGIPLPILKAAKKDGCAAFKPNNAVELGQFIAFYFSRPGSGSAEAGVDGLDGMDWGERHKRAQALMAEQKLKERELDSIPKDVIEARDQRAAMRARQVLEKKLIIEGRHKLANRDINQITPHLEKVVDDVCACMAEAMQMKKLMAEVRASQDAEEDAQGDS